MPCAYRAFAGLLLLIAGEVSASIYKCVDARGLASYQQLPCPGGAGETRLSGESGMSSLPPEKARELGVAAASVLAMHKMILGFEAACADWEVPTLVQVRSARLVWETQNAALLRRANAILSDTLNAADRERLDANMAHDNAYLKRVSDAASQQEHVQWCTDYPGRIRSEVMDPRSAQPAYVELLMGQ